MNPSGFAYAPSVGTVLAAARANARWRRLMEGRARPFLMTKEGADMADETTEYDTTEPEEFVEQPDDVAEVEEIDYSDVEDAEEVE